MLGNPRLAATLEQLNAPFLIEDVEIDSAIFRVGVFGQNGEIAKLVVKAAIHFVLECCFGNAPAIE